MMLVGSFSLVTDQTHPVGQKALLDSGPGRTGFSTWTYLVSLCQQFPHLGLDHSVFLLLHFTILSQLLYLQSQVLLLIQQLSAESM